MNAPRIAPEAGDQPFREDPSHSFTMPARYYHDAAVFDAEKAAIFYKNWHYAGHVSQVAEPGQFLTTKIHEQNVFVARGRDGVLRAFFNVCAHRGHELLEGTGKKNVITCPYHAWSYGLDGKLRARPHFSGPDVTDTFKDGGGPKLDLVQVRCET